jgi:hypothetical protein
VNTENPTLETAHAALIDATIAMERCAKESNRHRRANIIYAWMKKYENLISDLEEKARTTE